MQRDLAQFAYVWSSRLVYACGGNKFRTQGTSTNLNRRKGIHCFKMDLSLYPREFVPAQRLNHTRTSGALGNYGSKLFAVVGTCTTIIETIDLDDEGAGWRNTQAATPFGIK